MTVHHASESEALQSGEVFEGFFMLEYGEIIKKKKKRNTDDGGGLPPRTGNKREGEGTADYPNTGGSSTNLLHRLFSQA